MVDNEIHYRENCYLEEKEIKSIMDLMKQFGDINPPFLSRDSRIFNELNIQVKETNLIKDALLRIYDDHWIILINEKIYMNMPQVARRYLSHELGHIILYHFKWIKRVEYSFLEQLRWTYGNVSKDEKERHDRKEDYAWMIGRLMLMPIFAFVKPEIINLEEIIIASRKFNVNPMDILIRIYDENKNYKVKVNYQRLNSLVSTSKVL